MNKKLCEALLQMWKRDLDTRSRLIQKGELYEGYAAEMEKVHNEKANQRRRQLNLPTLAEAIEKQREEVKAEGGKPPSDMVE